MPRVQSRRWLFTLNNWSEEEAQALRDHAEQVTYLVFGREVAPTTGTPHLQGFIVYPAMKRLTACRHLLPRAHWTAANGTSIQCADYCKKDGEFEEFGILPANQGKRNDIEEFKKYIDDLTVRPSRRELQEKFFHLVLRYGFDSLYEKIDVALDFQPLVDGETPRAGWQTELQIILDAAPANRIIHFVVDPVGNTGKTWFTHWLMDTRPDDVQVLTIGKRDDCLKAIDPNKWIFCFDIPRDQMQYFQYSVVEQLKNMTYQDNKYHSATKRLRRKPHVVVFSNEPPDYTKLSDDRIHIINAE